MSKQEYDEDLYGPLETGFEGVSERDLLAVIRDEGRNTQDRRNAARELVEREWTLKPTGANWWRAIQPTARECPALVGPVLWAYVRREEPFTLLNFFKSVEHLLEAEDGVPAEDFALQIVCAVGEAKKTTSGSEQLGQFFLHAPNRIRRLILFAERNVRP